MREIKFRAWDKVRKEYLSAGQILISIEPGRRPKQNNIYLDILKDANKYNDRFIIEQYTGLKDKNGKEIYEGDILGDIIGCGVVVWINEESRFGIDVQGEIHEIRFEELEQNELYVIGNVFENPELLKGAE